MAIFRFFFKLTAVRDLEFVLCVWTTHEEHLVFFVTLQSLVGISAVVR